eukprot:6213826-Pleurochrysis_carterae.AAC.2
MASAHTNTVLARRSLCSVLWSLTMQPRLYVCLSHSRMSVCPSRRLAAHKARLSVDLSLSCGA